MLLDDLFKDLKNTRWWMRILFEPVARPAMYRFARVMANLDHITAYQGFREAMCHAVLLFTNATQRFGTEKVPDKGPLLVVSNHPGTCDSMIIASCLPRDDLKIIAIGYPLLQSLPNANQHMILIPQFGGGFGANITVVRSAIRHLEEGGSVLIFPSGKIEPDPAISPGALESIERTWSPSIELFLRKVPQMKIQFTAVSGVLSPFFMKNPLNKRFSGARDPQAVAETFQILFQMLFEKLVNVKPSITFGMPKTIEELKLDNKSLFQSIIAEAGQLLTDHMRTSMQV
jgi:hypothetical protein